MDDANRGSLHPRPPPLLAEDKRLKLVSPNFVVSDTRLSVRNIPLAWTERQLKQAFIAAVCGCVGVWVGWRGWAGCRAGAGGGARWAD